jgi:hypothetical protein
LLEPAARAAGPLPFLRPSVAASLAAVAGGLTLAAAPARAACNAHARVPANGDPGRLVLADGFERGGFGSWTRIVRGGDARVRVQTSAAAARGCVAAFHVTGRARSRASLVKALPAGTRQVWATAWFDVTRQGRRRSSNVPSFRLFNGFVRVLDISRQNRTGALFVRWRSGRGYSVHETGVRLARRRWYQIKVHAVANGAQSQVTVWVDGVRVLTRTGGATGFASFGSARRLTALRLGAEHMRQDGDFSADDVVVKVA